MKTVVPTEMVCHLWANQSQSHAKNSNGHVFFNDSTIYSYGSHFPMGRIITRKGKRAVLLNCNSYSNTTSGHQSKVRYACRHITPRFNVPNIAKNHNNEIDHEANLAYYKDKIVKDAMSVSRARSNKDWKARNLQSLVNEANSYSQFFGLRKKFKEPTEIDLKKVIEQTRKEAAARDKRQKDLREQQLAAMAEDIKRWQDGQAVSSWNFPNTYLRTIITQEGKVVETSRGAQVPLDHALKILPLIRSGKPYKHNGHSIHVGQFRIDEIDTEGNVKAGCHFIERQEIERFATTLGL